MILEFHTFRMDLLAVSIILAEKLMHIFSKTDDNHESRTESANQEHRHQQVLHDFEKDVHSKSVLPSTLNA